MMWFTAVIVCGVVTVTVTVAVAVPPAPTAVSVYVAVAVGDTVKVPAPVPTTVPFASVSVSVLKLVPLVVSVEDCPVWMLVGTATTAAVGAAVVVGGGVDGAGDVPNPLHPLKPTTLASPKQRSSGIFLIRTFIFSKMFPSCASVVGQQ